jgi:hypothetical protein
MENIAHTRSELEHLRIQLDAIDEREIVETELKLRTLRSGVVDIEKKELDETESMLGKLAADVVLTEKAHFSFLKIFGIESSELVHSTFLAWLLDPLGSHGLGSQFVEGFINKVASKTQDLGLSSLDFSSMVVAREIIGDESRLDIRIGDPHGFFCCIIENKILSEEGADQTNRLYESFHSKSLKELFVFLTLDESAKPQSQHFVSLTYREILPIIQSLLQEVSDADTRFLIRNYVNTLERLIVSENFAGFSERTKLYYQYQKYINDVRKAFDQDRQLLLKTLEDGIKHRPWWNEDLWDMERTGGSISIWKKAWYRGDDGVYLLLEASTEEPAYSLFIFCEPAQFSAKFGLVFASLLNQKYVAKLPGGFSKTFAKGVTRFIQKDVHLSLTEKDQPHELLKNLDELLDLFEKIIDGSFAELGKK